MTASVIPTNAMRTSEERKVSPIGGGKLDGVGVTTTVGVGVKIMEEEGLGKVVVVGDGVEGELQTVNQLLAPLFPPPLVLISQ